MRDGIVAMLNAQADMHVVGTKGSGDNILLKASQTKPQVTLVGADLKNIKGSSAIELIRKKCLKFI